MKRTHALILGGIITIIVAVVAFSTGYDLSTIRWGRSMDDQEDRYRQIIDSMSRALKRQSEYTTSMVDRARSAEKDLRELQMVKDYINKSYRDLAKDQTSQLKELEEHFRKDAEEALVRAKEQANREKPWIRFFRSCETCSAE